MEVVYSSWEALMKSFYQYHSHLGIPNILLSYKQLISLQKMLEEAYQMGLFSLLRISSELTELKYLLMVAKICLRICNDSISVNFHYFFIFLLYDCSLNLGTNFCCNLL